MLRVDKINAHYGPIQALWNVTMTVDEGEIVSVLGANGAGKSTLVKSIMGLLDPTSGTITFGGQRISGQEPHRISRLGIAYAPEGGGLFRDMSVRENLELGAYQRAAWHDREQTLQQVWRLFPILEDRRAALARTLSGGERQMLVIGRALMSQPRLCIFDEPSIGMSPRLVEQTFRIVSQLRDERITVLLIEQNVRKSLGVADRAYVLENGRIVIEGLRDELLDSDLVQKAYLGL
jgi:branched-chain amino acid transport system ATP-binding protein